MHAANPTRFFAIFAISLLLPQAGICSEALDEGLSLLAQDVEYRRNSSPIQSFYIASESIGDFSHTVYWPEARLLILVADADDAVLRRHLHMVVQWIDLEKDLVSTNENVGTSTYLHPEDWAADLVDTALRGRVHRVRIEVANRLEPIAGD